MVYLTGEAAEGLGHDLPTFQKEFVEQHEDVALWATLVVVATGCLAATALWRSRRWPTPSLTLTRVVLVGLLASTVVVGVAAWTGGPIGHPKLRPGRTAE